MTLFEAWNGRMDIQSTAVSAAWDLAIVHKNTTVFCKITSRNEEKLVKYYKNVMRILLSSEGCGKM